MKRIGLTQRVEQTPHMERRNCLDKRWAPLLVKLGFFPIPLVTGIPFSLSMDVLALDGVILTGGNDIAQVAAPHAQVADRDSLEEEILEFSKIHGLPVLGVCRGMQFMNAHFGGSVIKLDKHVLSRHTLPGDKQSINSYHNYGISQNELAPDFLPGIVLEDSSIESILHKNLPIAGIMWHPEREENLADMDKKLFLSLFTQGRQSCAALF